MTASLSTRSMIDPWESLKVNERRQLLGGVNALNGNGGPQIDLYDISGDCRNPQMLTGASVGLDDGTGQYVAAVRGHEGNFAPDGLTYYGANLGAGYIYPIDISNTTKPRMLTQYFTAPGRVHGLAFSDDGNRGYVAIAGEGGAARARREPHRTTVSSSSTRARSRRASQIRRSRRSAWSRGTTAAVRSTRFRSWSRANRTWFTSTKVVGGRGKQHGRMAGGLRCRPRGVERWPVSSTCPMKPSPFVVSKLMLENYDLEELRQGDSLTSPASAALRTARITAASTTRRMRRRWPAATLNRVFHWHVPCCSA